MPSLFKTSSVETLERRRESVEREIAGLIAFRDRIDRRIAHLKSKQPVLEIVVDDTLPPGVIEFHHPDGRRERVHTNFP